MTYYSAYDMLTYNNSNNSNQQEVEVDDSAELLGQILREEREGGILGCLDLVVFVAGQLLCRPDWDPPRLRRPRRRYLVSLSMDPNH